MSASLLPLYAITLLFVNVLPYILSVSPHLQTLICLGHQRIEEEFNDAALAGSNFGGDAHAWQQFELVLPGAFIVIQFNFSFINEAFLIILNGVGTNIFNCPLQVAVTLG